MTLWSHARGRGVVTRSQCNCAVPYAVAYPTRALQLVEEMRLSNETLLLAYNFLDRYLSCMSVANNNLKLTTITCLWVASKLCDGPVSSARCAAVLGEM